VSCVRHKSVVFPLVDLHDGADGRPVVRHAFTFIKDAYLEEILIQIKEFAFYTSPYVSDR
jgi:hypothetical protein